MADLIGFTSLSVVSLLTFILASRNSGIFNILIVALIIRIATLLFGHYIAPLPDSTSDAVGFEIRAWSLAQDGFLSLISKFEFNTFIFFSWLHAIPYSLLGRSVLLAQSISLFFGIGTIFLGWKIANILWDRRTANKVGWTMALFPSLILYSVLFMREVYICFFLTLALYGIILWVKTDSFKSILFALTGFAGATLFHGAMFVGAIVFVIALTTIYLKRFFKLIKNYKVNFKNLLLVSMFVIVSSLYFSDRISIQYLGQFSKINSGTLLTKINYAHRGDASWPEFTKASSENELLYKAPLRFVYFVMSPFPWDVKKTKHLFGMIDAFLYTILSLLILINIKVIWRDPALRFIFILLLAYIVVFSFGVGNFGTGIRHRSKFTFLFIILAAPLIKTFVFSKIKKN